MLLNVIVSLEAHLGDISLLKKTEREIIKKDDTVIVTEINDMKSLKY